MITIKVVVIDDEKAMHLIMKKLIAEINDVELVGCYHNAEQALQYIEQYEIDLVFIDMMIGQDHGLDVARKLRARHSEINIVFVTSHKEYAIDSFDSYPLDYMIKPVSKSRIEQTLARAAAKRQQTMIANDPKLVVRALGDLEVRGEQVGPAKWISKRSMELFAYLLMQRGRPVLKSKIIEHIYPDIPEKNAAIYMNTNVYQLRKTLDALGFKDIIVHSQEQYWLLIEQIHADFWQLQDQLSYFNTIEIDSQNIDQALACEQLYTGPLLQERSYDWAITEQIRLHSLYSQFAKRLITYLLNHQRVEQAITLIKKLLLNDEWDEEANLLLLQAYQELEDYINFKLHFEHISSLYQKELSVPLPEQFTALHHKVVQALKK